MKTINMVITFAVLPIYWIRSIFLKRFGSEEAIYKELKRYPKHYLGFRRIRIKAHGDQVDAHSPAIFLSNHQSMNDIFVTLGSVNRRFRFIAKKELFTNPISGPFMKMSDSYPLDRDDARASLVLLKDAVRDVNEGSSILAFPEGTRSHQKDLLEFKDGMFAILRRAKVPIVPMYIKESYNEKQKVINVYFAEAIEPEIYNKLKGKDLSELVFEKMNALKLQAYKE